MNRNKKWDTTVSNLMSDSDLPEEKKKKTTSLLNDILRIRDRMEKLMKDTTEKGKLCLLEEAINETDSIISAVGTFALKENKVCLVRGDNTASLRLLVIDDPLNTGTQNKKTDAASLLS